MSLRVEWRRAAEVELLDGVRSLADRISIATAVHRLAERQEGPAERYGSDPRSIRMTVAGGYVVSMAVDAFEQVLVVLALTPAPDPATDPDEDPEPDSFEEDTPGTPGTHDEAPPSSGR